MKRKMALRAEIKDDSEGRVRAVVATTGVRDRDGDLLERGAVGRQKVQVSAFGHQSWQGALPVGRGTVREVGDEVEADLQFFDTRDGQEHFQTIKELGSLAKWSFGFDVNQKRDPSPTERQDGIQRVLQDLTIHEVSPVLRPASIGTRTVSAKCDACAAKGTTASRELVEEAKSKLEQVDGMLESPLASSPPVARQYDPTAERRAKFAANLGHRLAGATSSRLTWNSKMPRVAWFKKDYYTSGYVKDGRHQIHLSEDLRGRALVKTALHEAFHLNQAHPKGAGSEGKATRFADAFAPAVEAAFEAGVGSWKVKIRDGKPPWSNVEDGEVVISTTTKKVFQVRDYGSRRWVQLR